MQYWTKKKPDRPGYWWAKDEDETCVKQILLIEDVLYVNDYYDDLVILEHKLFNNYLWGTCPISEPVGEKI